MRDGESVIPGILAAEFVSSDHKADKFNNTFAFTNKLFLNWSSKYKTVVV